MKRIIHVGNFRKRFIFCLLLFLARLVGKGTKAEWNTENPFVATDLQKTRSHRQATRKKEHCKLEMSSLNNKIGASMYYLCATSTMFALVVMVVGAIAPATLATDIELVPATSTGMHNLIASQATEAVTVTEASATNEADDDKSNNLNNKIQKNNRIGSAMVLLPSMSSSASDNGHLASNSSSMRQHHKNDRYQQELHSNDNANEDRMEQSEGYLHLDEHNFVATTPKIQTTKLPNR